MKKCAVILFLIIALSFQGDASTLKWSDDKSMHPSPAIESLRSKRSHDHQTEGFQSTPDFWRLGAQNALRDQLKKQRNENVAKNLILFLGDGMSIPTITAARIYHGQTKGDTGEESSLSFEEFPHLALSKTYCYDKQTADSACSATAYLTGVKANYATIGLGPKAKFNDCEASLDEKNQVNSILAWAQEAGKATGIVTTTRITHASPAGTYAHIANRDWESDTDMKEFNDTSSCADIAKQLIRESPGDKFNVIFGGGRRKFLSNKHIEDGDRGDRSDDLDLIDEWLTTKNSSRAHYVHDLKSLNQINPSDFDYVLGLFNSDHMQYQLNATCDQPDLKKMTLSAIDIVKKNPKGFVLFIEGGRIDHAHHANMARHALEETVQFSEAIKAAVEATDEKDTLIVVTADHAHTMTLNGYSSRGKDVLGLNSELSDIDGMPYSTLSYANGPSAKTKRHHMTEDDMKPNDFEYPSMVPVESETHGGDDVAIFARGPYSHLFNGVLEQNTIPHFMAFAACIGNGLTACSEQS